MSPDSQLVLDYRSTRSDTAFKELHSRYNPRLRRFVSKYIGQNIDAIDDIIQDIWIAILKSLANYEPEKPFENWAYLIARRQLMNAWRHRYRTLKRAPPSGQSSPSILEQNAAVVSRPKDPLIQEEDAESVQKALSELPPKLRTVIHQRFFERLSMRQIAEVNCFTFDQVRWFIKAGLQKLQRALP
jgi:RNA polymerase sigma-70 factor (ECF subfamily)